MTPEDLVRPNSGYYRDNLLGLLEAIDHLCGVRGIANTGDWYWELRDMLEEAGGRGEHANVPPKELAERMFTRIMKSSPLILLAKCAPQEDEPSEESGG